MIIFRNREHSEFEFASEEDLKFKAAVRCHTLVGHWASKKLGLAGSAADSYAKDVVARYLEDPDADSVFRKIRSDFRTHGIAQSEHRIRRTMDEFMTHAIAELKAGR
jgi:hypothetical protein